MWIGPSLIPTKQTKTAIYIVDLDSYQNLYSGQYRPPLIAGQTSIPSGSWGIPSPAPEWGVLALGNGGRLFLQTAHLSSWAPAALTFDGLPFLLFCPQAKAAPVQVLLAQPGLQHIGQDQPGMQAVKWREHHLKVRPSPHRLPFSHRHTNRRIQQSCHRVGKVTYSQTENQESWDKAMANFRQKSN